jgi:hypothetical protein
MELEFKDAAGRRLSEGDWVAYSTRDSCMAYLRFAKVLGEGTNEWGNKFLQVRVAAQFERYGDNKPYKNSFLTRSERIVRVDADAVPEQYVARIVEGVWDT